MAFLPPASGEPLSDEEIEQILARLPALAVGARGSGGFQPAGGLAPAASNRRDHRGTLPATAGAGHAGAGRGRPAGGAALCPRGRDSPGALSST